MEKHKDKLIKTLIEKFDKLPQDRQKAVIFVIENFDLIKKMCENSEMTNDEIKKRLKTAEENGDYIMLGLLAAVQVFNKE